MAACTIRARAAVLDETTAQLRLVPSVSCAAPHLIHAMGERAVIPVRACAKQEAGADLGLVGLELGGALVKIIVTR